jgi:hypothetical protein
MSSQHSYDGKWFALCDDGRMSALGRHRDYEAADYTAEKLGLKVVWLARFDDTAQWADTIVNSMRDGT